MMGTAGTHPRWAAAERGSGQSPSAPERKKARQVGVLVCVPRARRIGPSPKRHHKLVTTERCAELNLGRQRLPVPRFARFHRAMSESPKLMGVANGGNAATNSPQHRWMRISPSVRTAWERTLRRNSHEKLLHEEGSSAPSPLPARDPPTKRSFESVPFGEKVVDRRIGEAFDQNLSSVRSRFFEICVVRLVVTQIVNS